MKCKDGAVLVGKKNIAWTWYDEVDADTWQALKDKTSNPISKLIEAAVDLFGDKFLDAEFLLKVRWHDTRDKEKSVR